MTFDEFLKDMEEIGVNPPEWKVKCDNEKCFDRGNWIRCYFFPEYKQCEKYNLNNKHREVK